MNSRQRRKERVYEHEVTIHPKDGDRYFEFDETIKQAKMWLQWRTKRKNYIIVPNQYRYQTFKFRNGALATVFALRWL
jgi:hypothetical protein